MKNAENRNLEDSFHIHNDGEGYPFVYRVAEDEQIEILHVAETLYECRVWMRKKKREALYLNQYDEAERAVLEEARAALAPLRANRKGTSK